MASPERPSQDPSPNPSPESPHSDSPDPSPSDSPSHNSPPYRHFQVDRHSLSRPRFYDISQPPPGPPTACIQINTLKRTKPSLTLHAGPSPTSPVVAVSHLVKLGGHFKIGLGDPSSSPTANVDAVAWDDMTRQNVIASEYRWETALPGGVDGERRRVLTWKRTRTVGVEGMQVKALAGRNYKLLDEAGDVLAVFTSRRTLRNCGVLEVRVDWGTEFDRLVVITCMSLYEKARRDSG